MTLWVPKANLFINDFLEVKASSRYEWCFLVGFFYVKSNSKTLVLLFLISKVPPISDIRSFEIVNPKPIPL
jgi:hypothetical protein